MPEEKEEQGRKGKSREEKEGREWMEGRGDGKNKEGGSCLTKCFVYRNWIQYIVRQRREDIVLPRISKWAAS